MSRRVVQKSETAWVRAQLAGAHGRLGRLAWVVKSHKKTGKPEDRLLAITDHRVVTYKKSALGVLAERHNGHLYDLRTVVYQHENELELHFKDWFVKFAHHEAGVLFKVVCEQLGKACCRWPEVARPTIDANALLLEAAQLASFGAEAARNNGAPGFVETYSALCSLYDVPVSPNFIRRAVLAHSTDSHALRLDWHGDTLALGHVQAMVGSVLHDDWFSDLSFAMGSADKAIKTIDSVAETVGPALSRVTGITRISFAHARLQANGAEIVISALRSNRQIMLDFVDFSFNQLGDRLVNELVEALGASQPQLRSLHLAAVGLTGRGMADILDRLVGCMELGKSLETLSVAHNTLGKRGAEALAAYLSTPGCGSGLKRLDISSTGSDLTALSMALCDPKCAHVPLESVSVGGSALTADSTRAFASLLAAGSHAISALNMSRVINHNENVRHLKKDSEAVETIVASLVLNPTLRTTSLRIAENHITTGLARKLASMCAMSTSLISLDVSDCDMGDAALALLCRGFAECRSPRLEVFRCGRNSKASDDSGGAGKWLARLVERSHHLRVLSVPGGRSGGHHLNPRAKQLWSIDLSPLFVVMQKKQQLAGGEASGGASGGARKKDSADESAPLALEELDISCNGLLDSHMQSLQSALRENTSLRKLAWQGNDTTFQCVRNFSHLLHVNGALTDIGSFESSATDKSQHTRDLIGRIREKLTENAAKLARLKRVQSRSKNNNKKR